MVVHEVFNLRLVFVVDLLLSEFSYFDLSVSVFFAFLLFSHGQLFVTGIPELGEFFLFLLSGLFFFLSAHYLDLTASVYCLLHFEAAALLVFEKGVCFVFSFGDLFVEDLLLVALFGP